MIREMYARTLIGGNLRFHPASDLRVPRLLVVLRASARTAPHFRRDFVHGITLISVAAAVVVSLVRSRGTCTAQCA